MSSRESGTLSKRRKRWRSRNSRLSADEGDGDVTDELLENQADKYRHRTHLSAPCDVVVVSVRCQPIPNNDGRIWQSDLVPPSPVQSRFFWGRKFFPCWRDHRGEKMMTDHREIRYCGYEIRKPPSKDDTTMQLWSPEGHWIAEIREGAWPGSAERILAAMNALADVERMRETLEGILNAD